MKKRKGKEESPDGAKAPAEDAVRAPRAKRKPRVSSPVELAAALRADAAPRAIEPAPEVPSSEPQAPVGDPAVAAGSQDIEEYAIVLQRRLEAAAPVVEEDDGDAFADTRALRDRIKEGRGVVSLLMFRIGHELFATDLASVEEAVELPEIHHLPEMPAAMLGAFDLRGRLTPVFSPAHVIGVPLRGAATAALLVRANGHRVGLAVNDVEYVLQVELASVREAPGNDATDGLLLGVAHHGPHLVALLDAEALVAGCVNGTATENA